MPPRVQLFPCFLPGSLCDLPERMDVWLGAGSHIGAFVISVIITIVIIRNTKATLTLMFRMFGMLRVQGLGLWIQGLWVDTKSYSNLKIVLRG